MRAMMNMNVGAHPFAPRGRERQLFAGIEHIGLRRAEVQRDGSAELEAVHARELRHQFAHRRVDVHEGVGARDLGQLHLAGQGDVARARVDIQGARAQADGHRARHARPAGQRQRGAARELHGPPWPCRARGSSADR
jgi:hypothetical protein